MPQPKPGEGDIHDPGTHPGPRLWEGILAVSAHGGTPERHSEGSVPGRTARSSDETRGDGEREREGRDLGASQGHLGSSVGYLIPTDARVGQDPLKGDGPSKGREAEEEALSGVDECRT